MVSVLKTDCRLNLRKVFRIFCSGSGTESLAVTYCSYFIEYIFKLVIVWLNATKCNVHIKDFLKT